MTVLMSGQPCKLGHSKRIMTNIQRIIFAVVALFVSVVVLPAPEAAAAGAVTTYERYIVPGTVPYAHQVFDTAPDFSEKASACGSTSLAMALGYLGKLSSAPGDVVAQFHPSYSFGREPAEAGLNAYGVSSNRLEQGTLQEIVDALERGNVVIAGTQITAVGHIVLVIGYERVGDEVYLIVNDPWGDANMPDYEWTARDNGEQVRYSWERAAVIWSIEVVGAKAEPAKPQGDAKLQGDAKPQQTLKPSRGSFWSALASAYSDAVNAR